MHPQILYVFEDAPLVELTYCVFLRPLHLVLVQILTWMGMDFGLFVFLRPLHSSDMLQSKLQDMLKRQRKGANTSQDVNTTRLWHDTLLNNTAVNSLHGQRLHILQK